MLNLNQRVIFVCQLSDSLFKVARFALARDLRRKVVGLDVENFSQDINEQDLSNKLNQFLKKLGYNNNPLIISLPRNQVTCRFLRVPSQLPSEIEKIACLQSARYLPYPPEELITGFQIVSAEKDGSAFINQIIVHKDVIGSYIKLFGNVNPVRNSSVSGDSGEFKAADRKEVSNGVKAAKLNIILSSYGICNLYDYLKPKENIPVMVIDVDLNSAEAVVVWDKKLIFSRSFKLSKDQEGLFIAEINKTQDAFLREVSGKPFQKIILLGRSAGRFKQILEKQLGLSVEILSYEEKTGIDVSFASLIGLGLKNINGYLSLLTRESKQEFAALKKTREYLRLSALLIVIILMFSLGAVRDFSNRNRYLTLLKNELAKVTKEARELENIDKRFRFLESRTEKKAASLALISEISQVMPEKVFLAGFNYEEDKQLTLRGEADELNSVFIFASQLAKVPSLNNFNIKVKYATKRKTQPQEIVDFEITCITQMITD